MKCGCYLLADSSLERQLFASSEHPWPQVHAKNSDMHQTESRAVWIIQPYRPWFTKVNCLFTHEFLSSYTMINTRLPTWAEEEGPSQYKGCGPHFSSRLPAPSAPCCLKRERWAGGSGQARNIVLAFWGEAAGQEHRTAEQEKQAHLDTSGHQQGVHNHGAKWYSGTGD